MVSALRELKNAGVPPEDDAAMQLRFEQTQHMMFHHCVSRMQKLGPEDCILWQPSLSFSDRHASHVTRHRTSLGIPLVEAAETEKVEAIKSSKGMGGDEGNADHSQEGAPVDACTRDGVCVEQKEKKGEGGGQGTVGGEGEDDLPDLEVYGESEPRLSRGRKGRKRTKKGKKRGKGAPKGEESVLL